MHFTTGKELIEILRQRLGSLGVAADGAVCFTYDKKIEVRLLLGDDEDEPTLTVYSVLGPIPHEGSAQFYKDLLQGHLFGAATANAAFGISKPLNSLILFRSLNATHYNKTGFLCALNDFVQTYKIWKDRINSGLELLGS